jgi:hypothetical protein
MLSINKKEKLPLKKFYTKSADNTPTSQKRIKRQTYVRKIINNENFAQFMTIKPNKKLIN